MVVGLTKLESKFIHFIQSLGPGGLAWPFDILSQAKNVGLAMALAWLGWAFLCQAWLGLGLEARPSTSLMATRPIVERSEMMMSRQFLFNELLVDKRTSNCLCADGDLTVHDR